MVESRSLLLNPFAERGLLRERRRMAFVRLAAGTSELCAGNVHLSTGPREQTEQELGRAARAAVALAGSAPLLLGGDFNVRPWSTTIYGDLEQRFGLAAPTAPDAIDHLLVRGMDTIEAPHALPVERRELAVPAKEGERRLRLSDHAPVQAAFVLRGPHVP
jgi:endonuclease/exonuclease/phosphatase (EEP) superfamily protein YafD